MVHQERGKAVCAYLLACMLGLAAGAGQALAQPPVVETDGEIAASTSRAAVVEPATPPTASDVLALPATDLGTTEIQPIVINPRWQPLKLDLQDVVLPTDTASLIKYLAEGYFPQETQLSLEEAVTIALKNNHDLNSSRLTAAAACKGIAVNWAALKPQLSLLGKAYWQRDNSHSTTTATKDDQDAMLSSLALSLTQRIYDWGLSHRLIDTARAQFAIQNSAVDMAEQQLVADVIADYYLFSSALGRARIRRDELALAQMLLSQAQLRLKVGTVPRLDVVRAEARVEQARESLIAALAALGDAAAEFYAVLGVEDQRYVPAVITTALLDTGADPQAVAAVIQAAIASRPELELQYATLAAGEAKVELAKNRPLLEAYSNAALKDPAPQSGSASVEYGLQLKWNLYSGGSNLQERQQAQMELQAVSESVLGLEAKIELDATKAWNRLYAARASTASARKNLELSAESLRIAAIGYAAGVITFVDYQDALDTNVAAALGYLEALVEVKLAQVNLERAQGFPAGYPGDSRAQTAGARTVEDIVMGAPLAPVAPVEEEYSNEQ
jgi:outer membrane protein TolC